MAGARRMQESGPVRFHLIPQRGERSINPPIYSSVRLPQSMFNGGTLKRAI